MTGSESLYTENSIVMVVPLGCRAETRIWALWSVAMRFTMARPKPVPVLDLEK